MNNRIVTVSVSSADNVWLLEAGDRKSKAAILIRFPGSGDDCVFESEQVEPILSISEPLMPADDQNAGAEIKSISDRVKFERDAKPVAETENEASTDAARKIKEGTKTSENSILAKNKVNLHSKSEEGEATGKKKASSGSKVQKNKDSEKVAKKVGADRADDTSGAVALQQTLPASFNFEVVNHFKRISEWPLWNSLMNEALMVSLIWVSAGGSRKAIVGSAKVDISKLLYLQEGFLEGIYRLEPLKTQDMEMNGSKEEGKSGSNKENTSRNVAEKADPKSLGLTSKKDGKDVAAPQKGRNAAAIPVLEEIPTLLDAATLKVTIFSNIPLLSGADFEAGLVIEICDITLKPVPPNLLNLKEANYNDPFTYDVAFELPGFTGSWWESVPGLRQEEKNKLSLARALAGICEVPGTKSGLNETNNDKVTELGCSPSVNTIDNKSDETSSSSKNSAAQPSVAEKVEIDDSQGIVIAAQITQASIAWPAKFKRFLPSLAVSELKKAVRRKQRFYGEVARYITEDNLFDPLFELYHGSFWLNLLPLLEEGITEATIVCPLENCPQEGPDCSPLFVPAIRKSDAKAIAIEDQSKYAFYQSANENQNGVLKNAWTLCQSSLTLRVKLSHALEPLWAPPAEPEIKLSDVLPPRPKLQTVHHALEIATRDFKEFVQQTSLIVGCLFEQMFAENQNDNAESLINSKVSSTIQEPRTYISHLNHSKVFDNLQMNMSFLRFLIAIHTSWSTSNLESLIYR
ncbi:hypothetical protein O6H91_16G073200 [Diphasiastrum complanatum]|uniref:Uncharacterized protein n=1 Tax=Diphasiastrum complanatum TaxID=34168 RepID=A0ACC2BDJ5_DIPCM|nr:hypothetical protein O6H91_16G073200 [Diphasiastrum complanatum]